MLHRIRAISNSLRSQWRSALWSARWADKPKTISALIRVRDGEEFLASSTESIISVVEEVVFVDNRSSDKTPQVIQQLASRYPGKIQSFSYDHDVVPVGEASHELNTKDPASPRLLPNYYNWCMAKCRQSFVMKWDDDMIATLRLLEEINRFKNSKFLQFDFGGHNLSADFKNVLEWKAGIEPRIFPAATRFKMVDYGGVLKSGKSGKYAGEAADLWVADKYKLRVEAEMYAHLKYCKRDPGKNQSASFRKELEAELRPGGGVPADFISILEHFNLPAKNPSASA